MSDAMLEAELPVVNFLRTFFLAVYLRNSASGLLRVI